MKSNICNILFFVVLNVSAFAQHCPVGQVEVFFNLTGTINGNVPALGLDTDKNGAPDTWVSMYDANNTSSSGTDGWYQCSVCLTENTQYWYIYRDALGTWEGPDLSADFNGQAGCGVTSWEGNPCYDCPVRAGASWAQRVLDVGTSPVNVHETIGQCPSARNGDGSFTQYETRNIQVLPNASGNVTATDRVHNSDGWVSFWRDVNSTPTDFSDDYILMSVKEDNINWWNFQYDRARINAPVAGTAQWHVSNPSTFINSSVGGSGRLQRIWSYTWTTALASTAGVRLYYTDAEFTALNSTITTNGGVALADATEMEVYKVTNNGYAWDISNLSASDVILLNHDATPSTTKYKAATNGTDVNYVEFDVSAFGNTGFNGGGIVGTSNGATALPVELVEFTGKVEAQQVKLNWTTATEVENDYFEIQHSLNGTNFETIGTVDGSGNSIEPIDYDFIHQTPVNGVNYYRLSPVAFDGTVEYSDIISVSITTNKKLTVFPSIVTNDYLNVNFEGTTADLLIYNQTGQQMLDQTSKITTGLNRVQVGDLPVGMYFLIVQDGTARQTVKFIKQ